MPPKQQTDNTAMRELKKALRQGGLKNLYVFYGDETFLREYYLGELKKAILPQGMEDFNLHTAQGKECSVDWIAQAVDCLPMMSERTLVLVTDFELMGQGEKGRQQLIELFEDLPDYCCLVFVYDLLNFKVDGRSKLGTYLKKSEALVNFQRQSTGDLTDWIVRKCKAMGHRVDSADAQYLIFLCGDSMTNLSTELEKICAYASGERVTREDMDAVAIPQVDAVVFQMTDALARRDFDKAAAVLADLLHSQEAPIMILSVMGKYFRQLYTARLYLDAGKSRSDFMQLWGMKHSFQGDKLMDAARKFSLVWCRHAVRRCAEADLQMKVNYGAEGEILTQLLMELSAGRKVIRC